MKFTINKVILDNLLAALQPFLEKKDNSQITSHVILIAKGDALTLRATDNEIGLALETKETKIIEEGISTANGKKIAEIVRSLKDCTPDENSKKEMTLKNTSQSYLGPRSAVDFPKKIIKCILNDD